MSEFPSIRVPYVSDNPYRLASVGSSTLHEELRRRGKTAAQAAKVGIPYMVGLEAHFGAEDLMKCADIVHSTAGDPVKRTIYRLFWPVEYSETDGGNTTIDAFQRLMSNSKGFQQTQFRFLMSWYWFALNASPDSLETALTCFEELYLDDAFDAYLLSLLISEGEPDDMQTVYDAQQDAIAHLYSHSCRQALDYWKQGDFEKAVQVVKLVAEEALGDEDERDKILLQYIRPLGDGEVERLTKLCQMPGLGRNEKLQSELRQRSYWLSKLGKALQNTVPPANHWVGESQTAMLQLRLARAASVDITGRRIGAPSSARQPSVANPDQRKPIAKLVYGAITVGAWLTIATITIVSILAFLWLFGVLREPYEGNSQQITESPANVLPIESTFRRNSLIAEQERMHREMEELSNLLSEEEMWIEEEMQGVEQNGYYLDIRRVLLDHTDEYEMDEFNAAVRTHNQRVNNLKKTIRDYNRKVDDLRALNAREMEIQDELDEVEAMLYGDDY